MSDLIREVQGAKRERSLWAAVFEGVGGRRLARTPLLRSDIEEPERRVGGWDVVGHGLGRSALSGKTMRERLRRQGGVDHASRTTAPRPGQ